MNLRLTLASLCVSLCYLVSAAAVVDAAKRDVFVPRILYPNKPGIVWEVGSKHNITWDTSDAPANISNGAMVILRKGDRGLPLILAKDFNLRKGRVEVKVPWVMPDDDYSIVLFGDSGNWSNNFSIQGSL